MTLPATAHPHRASDRPLRIVYCWPEISGYMAACWRALLAEPGIELAIVAHRSGKVGAGAAFGDEVVASLPCQLLDPAEQHDAPHIASIVAAKEPDVIVLPGWCVPEYSQLVWSPQLQHKRFVMCMDTPLKNSFRQRLARLKIGKYLDRMDAVMVTGERSWQYARTLLKIPERKIRRGCYGIDHAAFSPSFAARSAQPGGWPKRFLFMGRYVDVKGLDVLMAAYHLYRSTTTEPWTLTCHGKGPLAHLVADDGVTDAGFIQPADQPRAMAQHGVFILPSLYDPWPLAVVEACASGMPVICSNACGSAVELIRPYFNGLTVATKDPEQLAAAMRWMHDHHHALREMGGRGQHLAAAYSAPVWAQRSATMCREVYASASPR